MATKANGSTVDVAAVLAAAGSAALAAEAATTAAREGIEARLEEIEAEADGLRKQLKELGGKAKARKSSGKRASNDVTLIAAVANVIAEAKSPLMLSAICEGVEKSGYKTNADNFKTMVSQSVGNLVNLKVGASRVVVRTGEPRSYEYAAGSGMKRYLANPESAVKG